MFFASDNAGPAHPQVMQAMVDANTGFAMPYGNDPIMVEVRARMRAIFEAPEAAIYLVATGTAANSLALATLGEPWQTVFCSPVAHIHEDECNAPEFYSGGAKLTLVGDSDKMTPAALRAAILAEQTRGVHGPQRGPVSITNVTERGRVYTCDEIAALFTTRLKKGMRLQSDPTIIYGISKGEPLYNNQGQRRTLYRSEIDRHTEWNTYQIDGLPKTPICNPGREAIAAVLNPPETEYIFFVADGKGGHLFAKTLAEHNRNVAAYRAYERSEIERERAN
jgi:hypothetical protein